MLPLILLGIGALALIVIALLNWEKIKKFIRKVKEKLGLRVGLDENDKTAMANTIKEAQKTGDCAHVNCNLFGHVEKDNTITATVHTYEDGKHETIYGVFSKKTGEVIEAERVQSKEIDETIERIHKREKIVIHV
jgi:hypothetical protein